MSTPMLSPAVQEVVSRETSKQSAAGLFLKSQMLELDGYLVLENWPEVERCRCNVIDCYEVVVDAKINATQAIIRAIRG